MSIDCVKDDGQVARRLAASLTIPTAFRTAIVSNEDEVHSKFSFDMPGTERFSSVRMRRFQMGRAGAEEAMRALGMQPDIVLIGPNRAPVWPTGIIGSITHSADVSVAIVARSTAAAAIGIDLETAGKLAPSHAKRISAPGEFESIHVDDTDAGVLLFSAKEAIFKCVSRIADRYIDFRDIAVEFDTERMTFRIRWSSLPAIQSIGNEIRGQYRVDAASVMTLALRETHAQ